MRQLLGGYYYFRMERLPFTEYRSYYSQLPPSVRCPPRKCTEIQKYQKLVRCPPSRNWKNFGRRPKILVKNDKKWLKKWYFFFDFQKFSPAAGYKIQKNRKFFRMAARKNSNILRSTKVKNISVSLVLYPSKTSKKIFIIFFEKQFSSSKK